MSTQTKPLFLQDPTNSESLSLHEALLSASSHAHFGGGMFSFVSQGGVQLLLEDTEFKKFMRSGTFELIVGIDEVTNTKALARLKNLASEIENFKVSAFLHEGKRSLFHPKFCWFKTDTGGRLVIGSGNLTYSGLRNNWESYSVIELNEDEFLSLEITWSDWLRLHSEELEPVDDGDVVEAAKLNVWKRKSSAIEGAVKKEKIIEEEQEINEAEDTLEDSILWKFNNSDEALIAEIPRSGNRWAQVNFDKETFVNFFGAIPGNNSQRILLRSISSTGDLGTVESRQSVSVVSQNYRFELGVVSGIDYPSSGRPLGIFIKIAKRVFLYCVVMPGNEEYQHVLVLLNNRWSGREDRMKRVNLTVSELRQGAKELSFWQLPQDS